MVAHTSGTTVQTPLATVLPPHGSSPSSTMQYSPFLHLDFLSASGPTSHGSPTTSAASVVVEAGTSVVVTTASSLGQSSSTKKQVVPFPHWTPLAQTSWEHLSGPLASSKSEAQTKI